MESEEWPSSYTSEDLLGSADCVAADFDDDLEDDYENIEKFRKEKSAARSFPPPSSSSSWRPSRFEGSSYASRRCLKKMSPTLPPYSVIKICALESAPILEARQCEIPVEVLHKVSKRSSPLRPSFLCGAASMSDRLRPPAASQVSDYMPPSVEPLSNIRRILPDAMMSRTDLLIKRRPAPPSPPLSSYEPPSSDLPSFESLDFIEARYDSLRKMSPIFCPRSPIVSSATEFATELYASNTPVCADPPPPPLCLASRRVMSMTPSPAPLPEISRRACASFFRRRRAGDSIAFAEAAVSPAHSPTESGGFGGFLRGRNESLGSGSSAPVARRKERKQRLLRDVEKPDTVAWNELFELQHEVFTHDLIQ